MALMPYVTGGFPSLAAFTRVVETLAESGADVIEVGIPFSDPIADGPAIQYASEMALRGGATVRRIVDALAPLDLPCPVVLMSYLNPLLAYGMARFLGDCHRIGTAGLIVPDLPFDESDEWREACRGAGVRLIQLAAPTSPDARIRRIARQSSGFLYCVSLPGTTGVRAELPKDLTAFLERVKRHTDLPTAVGFGISTPDHVRALVGRTEGVIVGSRVIEAIRHNEDLPKLIREFKAATREEINVDCHARRCE